MTRCSFATVLICLSSLARAEPVTWERVNALPAEEQPVWRAYLKLSEAKRQADAAALVAEVAANRLTNALRAPDGGDFKLKVAPGDDWYASAEAGRLADVILSYQTPSGGWSKHTGYDQGPRQPGMQWTSQHEPGKPVHYLATFDNAATTEQLRFLAGVWQATNREDCRRGFVRGLNFIFAAQFPNGGWPQGYPLEGGYHDHITFNDDAMTHILEMLHEITRGERAFGFLDASHREQASVALTQGLRCVMRIQVVQAGRKTAWGAQYDALTLGPAAARQMEPATLSGLESARLLEFLMSITNPPPELVAGIENGLQWLELVKVSGMRKTRENGRTAYVSDPAAAEIYWARFYDLTNSRPVFPGRDGVTYDSYAAMAAENRVGYDYYTTLPGSIVRTGQKKWRKMLANPPPAPAATRLNSPHNW